MSKKREQRDERNDAITAMAVVLAGDVELLASDARRYLDEYLPQGPMNEFDSAAFAMARDNPQQWALCWFLCLRLKTIEEKLEGAYRALREEVLAVGRNR